MVYSEPNNFVRDISDLRIFADKKIPQKNQSPPALKINGCSLTDKFTEYIPHESVVLNFKIYLMLQRAYLPVTVVITIVIQSSVDKHA